MHSERLGLVEVRRHVPDFGQRGCRLFADHGTHAGARFRKPFYDLGSVGACCPGYQGHFHLLLLPHIPAALDRWPQRWGRLPMQVALAWLLQRAPNVLLIPGTSSVGHLRENLASVKLELPPQTLAELDGTALVRNAH